MIPMSIAMLGVTALVAGGVGLYLRGRRRRARALYMAHLESALADGILTEAEAAELESLRTASDLSEREVRMVGLALYRRALREVVADARVTPEEEANLRRLQMQLGLTEHDLASDRDQIRRMRLLAQIEDGRLPEVRAPLDLAADETCHWVVRATLCSPLALGRREPVGVLFRPDGAEPFHVVGEREALEPNPAILPLDLGMLVITSRRAIFRGAKRRVDWPHARLETLTLYRDGLALTTADERGPRFLLVEDAELTAAILLLAARRRRIEQRGAPPAPNPSAALPGTAPANRDGGRTGSEEEKGDGHAEHHRALLRESS